MAKGTEIEIKNLGEKTGIKLISDDQGRVVIATEASVPLQPVKPDGKLDESAIHDNEAGEINAIAAKGSPVSTDLVLGEDSENGFEKVKFAVGDLGGGGGGATTFDGLSDTPVNKTGADGFLVKVNGVNLDFLDPATFATGDLNDYLAKAGGVMSGDIDFLGPTQGIRFWDTDAAYFRAFYFDPARGIVVGGEAPGLGGYVPVTADTFQFNIGVNGVGATFFGMWEDTFGDFLPVGILADGGPFEWGPDDRQMVLKGNTTRPQYNGGGGEVDLALLSDAGDATSIQGGDVYASIAPTDGQLLAWDNGNSRWDAVDPPSGAYDAAAIPRYGTGELHANIVNGLAVVLNPNEGAGVARVSARDLIHTIRGGGASLTYQLDGSFAGGPGPSATDADPTAAYLDLTPAADETTIIRVIINDGIWTYTYETYILVQDPFDLRLP